MSKSFSRTNEDRKVEDEEKREEAEEVDGENEKLIFTEDSVRNGLSSCLFI
jgi:hypothetical protein